ncbi:hypothetical protein PG999_009872 [Apiospora kogelbergensis]|uniref:Uncharacterized protein n=1 Tax=Apiospora kogelbergensis TaxID=1337665 RepID=A0AAW0QPN9_9PEZI
MDLSTASEASDASSPERAATSDLDIKVQNTPAIVRWRDTNGASQRLAAPVATPLGFAIDYDVARGSACLKLQAAIKMKRSSATSRLILSIKPSQLRALDFDESDQSEEQAHVRKACEELHCRVQTLRFELDSPPTLIAPIEHPFQTLRHSSQEIWTGWTEFARDVTSVDVYFSAAAVPRERLSQFCERLPRLASLRNDLASLYGGRGGLVVSVPAANAPSNAPAADAPPAYTEHSARSVTREPPLALSPSKLSCSLAASITMLTAHTERDASPSRKRRRAPSSSDAESTPEKQQSTSSTRATDFERIQHALDTQNMILAKILARVESIEGRLEALESRDLADDVQACVEPLLEPLWDELDSRIVASEDKTHDDVKDMVEDAVKDKVGDLPELVGEYFHEDEGRGLLHDTVAETVAEVVSERDERIRQDTMNFLRSRPFTAQFSFNDEG